MDLQGFRVPPSGGDLPAGLSVHLVPAADSAHLLDAGIATLGPTELRRATRPADEATQRTRLLSYVLLRRLLAERLGVAASTLEFAPAPERRPGLHRHPPRLRLAAAGGATALPHFSLSRSTELIAVALAPGAVGVDVEEWQSPVQAEQLRATLHPMDRRRLGRLPRPVRARAVTAAWTRKEAGLKALGTGLLRDPALDRTGSRRAPMGPPGVRVAQLNVPRPRRAELAVAWRDESA